MAELEKLSKLQDPGQLEERWLEALTDGFPAEDLSAALASLHGQGRDGLADQLLELALDAMESVSDQAARSVFLWRAALALPRAERLRRLLVEEVRDRYLMYPPLEAFLERSGLLDPEAVLSASARRLEELLSYQEGTYLLHEDFGPGIIESLSRDSLTASYESRKSHRMTIPTLIEKTAPLADDSLRVLSWRDPEGFRTLFEEGTAAFLERAVSEHGGELLSRDIVSLVRGTGLDEKVVWRRLIALSSGSTEYQHVGDSIAQAGEVDALDRIARLLRSRTSMREKADGIGKLLKGLPEPEATRAGELVLEAVAKAPRAESGAIFELVYLVAGGNALLLEELGVPLLERSAPRMLRALSEIGSSACVRSYLELVAGREGGPGLISQLLPGLPRSCWFSALEILLRADEALGKTSVSRLLGSKQDPELAARALEACSRLDLRDCMGDATELVEHVLQLFPMMRSESQRRTASALVESLSSHLAEVLGSMDSRRLSKLSDALEESGPAKESGLLLTVLRELSSRRSGAGTGSSIPVGFWESDAVYESRKAIEERKNALEHLLKRQIPDAAQAISEAASHGDLSENAEYTAALERRDLLLARARQWQRELEKMRVYPEAELSQSMVSPGTRVHLRTEEQSSPREVALDIVGPLSSNPAGDRISYMAPMAGDLLGKAIGDMVTLSRFPGIEYTIERIEILPEVTRSG
ncbi:GreA/GreB family elongation factor [Candidatus Fermentibacterales bacterium]|nr:GreA/GreB family elongation factor [Candidatus Fermentibacterales bacterium]